MFWVPKSTYFIGSHIWLTITLNNPGHFSSSISFNLGSGPLQFSHGGASHQAARTFGDYLVIWLPRSIKCKNWSGMTERKDRFRYLVMRAHRKSWWNIDEARRKVRFLQMDNASMGNTTALFVSVNQLCIYHRSCFAGRKRSSCLPKRSE